MGGQKSKSSGDQYEQESIIRSPGPALAVGIQLNNCISEFLNFYEPNIDQLRDLAEQLEKVRAERDRLECKAKKREKTVAVLKGVGHVASVLADGIPGLGYAARLGINAINGKVNTSKSITKLKSLWLAYRGIIKTLRVKMLDVVRGIEAHANKRNAPDTDVFQLLDLKSKMLYAIVALDECQQDSESENCTKVRQYRDKIELLKPAMERFR